ncbi:hypothetical protein KRE40_13860 [Elizabethkingia meningoseptica]|uniref:DUF3575 domain-containing protein n=1 Tax=Elizabethkingia meningoseptica TaxID=238 RepID=A0A1T3F7Y8_ELIME|nr:MULTISPECIES: hypothetical protein [Elizabethkingia]AQX14084.1 hypothetical protein BBD35_17675 [Elizabethkingia meningoseptica]MBG0515910.1 hypothetical protein [Elizabethkingia meningoseptica]MCL1677167.1 hypothetical protein [Elizabethkingia meningoseptica]MCL1686146.1 hypothetical protein [Elizabethkingia meningoseptica]MDE5435870.1 hypothetical protein [Elizabethkingia meningoseptica]
MRKIYVFTFITLFSIYYAQESSLLKKNMTGVQTSLLALGVYNESLVSDKLVIRSEVFMGLGALWGGSFYPKTGYVIIPSIGLAPRYYYNIEKRKARNANTRNNAANFLDITLTYNPGWLSISNYDDAKVNDAVFLIPNWGIRRNFAKNFNYEFHVGLGIGKSLVKGSDLDVVPSLGFRVGYDF